MGGQTSNKGFSGIWLTGAYFLAMMAFYIGERLLYDSTSARLIFTGTGAVLLLAAIFGRVVRAKRLGKMAAPVERRLLGCYLLGTVALLVYFAQSDVVMEHLRPMFDDPKAAEHYEGALAVLWVVLWVCAAVPTVFVELAYSGMDTARTVDIGRIRRSLSSGLVMAMSICLVFVLNFIANEFNEKIDLSYFKTTRASEASKRMAANLSDKMTVSLFFPGANEVQQEVESYFEDLKRSSSQLEVRVVDHALEPKLAKELGVHDNGSIVFSKAKQNHVLTLGTKIERAKSKLKNLDSEFQSAFLKLARGQKIAYFTSGHDERSKQTEGARKPIRDLRQLMEKVLNYRLKDLGATQGLMSEIPSDASVVVIVGPQKEFLAEEIAALKKYLKGGGRMMVFLDAENKVTLDGLLNPFGLKFTAEPLATERVYARRTMTKADRQIVVSNRFGTHKSVATLSRHSQQLGVVMLGAGFLEEIPPTDGDKIDVRFSIHSMPLTWNDKNSNFEFDKADEKRKVYEIAAAASMTVKGATPKGKGGKGADKPEMRLIVVADSDLVADGLLRATGNRVVPGDGLKWLVGEEKFIGETSSEEDVRIMHTRKEDEFWFYLTIFAIPATVLAGGLFYTRRRRKRS